MTRIASKFSLVLVIAAVAVPTTALAQQETGNSLAGPADYRSLDAQVAAGDKAPVALAEYRSLDAQVASAGSAPAARQVAASDGFDWSDGLIGALVGTALLLLTLTAARTIARHRRATVESPA